MAHARTILVALFIQLCIALFEHDPGTAREWIERKAK
jgi:hypothetical protein